MSSISPVGAAGLTAAGQRFERAATEAISAAGGGEGDAPKAVVETLEARAQWTASLGIIRASDEMIRELLTLNAQQR